MIASTALELARWQFGVTTVYHFLFVPVTIGMAWFVAGMQTAWHRTGNERYLRMTRFFGKLFLINFALGVVTGIVQEFQFGMNWADYSRYVGDVFGAPLAIEGLAAFFLESTFLGLWIFGWDKLAPKVHLAMIWLVAIGTTASAYFILAANSWMQHPVGYRKVGDHAEMTSLGKVFFQGLQITHFFHTITAALLTGGLLVLAVSAYWLRRGREVEMFRASAKRGARRHAVRVGGGGRDRPLPGADPDPRAADEDGGGRGALQDERPRAAVAVRGRAVGAASEADERRHPAAARTVGAGDELLEREDQGDRRGAARVPAEVRAGRLHADRRSRVLGLARDGRPRLPCLLLQRRRALAEQGRTRSGALAQVHVVGVRVPRPAVRRQHGRLAVHRDGAAAVDRAGAVAHARRRLARGSAWPRSR